MAGSDPVETGSGLLGFPGGIARRAFSSEVDTGSREENASKQEKRASVPIQSERKRL
jgi:hypothetical protein